MIQGDFPLWLLTLLLGLFLSAILFCTTTNDCPPTYHSVRIHGNGNFVPEMKEIYTIKWCPPSAWGWMWCYDYDLFFSFQLFALLGFVVSAVLISAAASEVVSILHMLGVVLSLSNTVLGLTLLAWGNSIGGGNHTHKSLHITNTTPPTCLTPLAMCAFFQTFFLTSPSHGKVTHEWPYLPALEASFSVSFPMKACQCERIIQCIECFVSTPLTVFQTCCLVSVWAVCCRCTEPARTYR